MSHVGTSRFAGPQIETATSYSWIIKAHVTDVLLYTKIYYNHTGAECGNIILLDMFGSTSNNHR